uniref:Uncharacterized protein n=2 Tax=Timema TaxID=61471 RepID=A0A7R9E610_9NEOP|nr:unnamed protein product [Timema monikensis]
MAGGKADIKIEPEEDLEYDFHHEVKLETETEIDFPIKSEEVFKQEVEHQEENETSSLTFPPIKEEFEEKEVRKKIEESNSNYNVSRCNETQLKRCWEKLKSHVWKQKWLERRHSKKIGRGEPFKTSPADDALAAQGLSIQPRNVETDTLWDSNQRHQQDSATVCAIKRPENSSFTSAASNPHIPIPFQTLQPSVPIQTLPSSTYTSLISSPSIPCSSITKEDILSIPNSSTPSQSQSQSIPHVPESLQHSCCQNPAVAPILQNSTPCTSSALEVLNCPAKSCSDNLFEVEAVLSSKKYNDEELKQMWEVRKKKLENENLLYAAHVKRLNLIQLERERVIQQRKSLVTEQARLEKRSAQIDVEMKELDLAITKFQ